MFTITKIHGVAQPFFRKEVQQPKNVSLLQLFITRLLSFTFWNWRSPEKKIRVTKSLTSKLRKGTLLKSNFEREAEPQNEVSYSVTDWELSPENSYLGGVASNPVLLLEAPQTSESNAARNNALLVTRTNSGLSMGRPSLKAIKNIKRNDEMKANFLQSNLSKFNAFFTTPKEMESPHDTEIRDEGRRLGSPTDFDKQLKIETERITAAYSGRSEIFKHEISDANEKEAKAWAVSDYLNKLSDRQKHSDHTSQYFQMEKHRLDGRKLGEPFKILTDRETTLKTNKYLAKDTFKRNVKIRPPENYLSLYGENKRNDFSGPVYKDTQGLSKESDRDSFKVLTKIRDVDKSVWVVRPILTNNSAKGRGITTITGRDDKTSKEKRSWALCQALNQISEMNSMQPIMNLRAFRAQITRTLEENISKVDRPNDDESFVSSNIQFEERLQAMINKAYRRKQHFLFVDVESQRLTDESNVSFDKIINENATEANEICDALNQLSENYRRKKEEDLLRAISKSHNETSLPAENDDETECLTPLEDHEVLGEGRINTKDLIAQIREMTASDQSHKRERDEHFPVLIGDLLEEFLIEKEERELELKLSKPEPDLASSPNIQEHT